MILVNNPGSWSHIYSPLEHAPWHGLTPTDLTPAATRQVIDREVPGMAEQMRAAGRASTPMASLSRGIVGSRGTTLIANLPGSPKGAVESIEALLPVLRHAIEQLAGGDH